MPQSRSPQSPSPATQSSQPQNAATLPTIGRIRHSPKVGGFLIQIRQHSETLAALNALPGARLLKTESHDDIERARRTGKMVSTTLSTYHLPDDPYHTNALTKLARQLREHPHPKRRGQLILATPETRDFFQAFRRQQAAQSAETQARLEDRHPEQIAERGTFLGGRVETGHTDSKETAPHITPIPRAYPDIRIITGQTEQTASQATALKIQAPRHPDSQEHLYNGLSNEGLYDLIMNHPGARYVKGTKGGRNGENARAAYFRVPITKETASLLTLLSNHYGLVPETHCPTLNGQPFMTCLKARLKSLADTHRLSTHAEFSRPLDIPAPKGLDYLPYQKVGIFYAVRQGNALIADEPGLGKTIQAIGTSNAVPEARRILVIVPASLKINWQREWQKWCTKGLRVDRVSGGKPENWPTPTDEQGYAVEPEVVIINFDLVEQHSQKLMEAPWDMMIVDEAHALKNESAKRTKAILGHGNGKNHVPGIPSKRTLLLTGTPILNRPSEIWSLAHALDPDYFSDKFAFERRYCDGKSTEFGWNSRGSSNLQELQRELRARIMVRRRKSQVLKDLPPKTRQLIELDHPAFAKTNDHYAKLEQASQTLKDCFERREALKDEAERIKAMTPNDPATQAAQSQYKQAASQLARESKVAFFQMSEIRKETALIKVPQVIDLIKTALPNGKLILFCHHSEVADAYRDALNAHFKKQAGKNGTPKTVAMVTGKTPNDQRQLEADRFQQDPDCQVFIGSIQAAGVGLTLTKASTVLFAELDWVPGNVSQAEDRAHRIGQRDHVLVYHAVIEGTLDSLMVRRLIEKQEVIDSALDDQVSAEQVQATQKTQEDRFGDWLIELEIKQAEKGLQQATQSRSEQIAPAGGSPVPQTDSPLNLASPALHEHDTQTQRTFT